MGHLKQLPKEKYYLAKKHFLRKGIPGDRVANLKYIQLSGDA